jgi:hypothetical protein
MAEPPSQESEAPPPSTFTPPTIPTNLRIHFATADRYGNDNASRLLQARQDLPIIHKDVPAEAQARYLPEHLYKMLPTSLHAFCGRAMYEVTSLNTETQKTGNNRTASLVAVAIEPKHLPESSTQRLAKRSGRMIFSSPPQQDAITASGSLSPWMRSTKHSWTSWKRQRRDMQVSLRTDCRRSKRVLHQNQSLPE